jgi:hypothetical protein
MSGMKWIAAGLLLVLVLTGGVAWWQRESLQVWWAVRGLSKAGEGDRDIWITRVVNLGEPAMFSLVDALADADDRACLNHLTALNQLAREKGVSDPVCVDLAIRLARPFSRLSSSGQAQLLHDVSTWFNDTTPADGLVAAVARLLSDAATKEEVEVHAAGMELAEVLFKKPCDAVVAATREMARTGLRSSSSEVRLKAVRLCLQPKMELLEQVVALLRDPSVEVRRAAILAIGPAEQVVRDDVLLPGLHDSDAEVRKFTEVALQSRGLGADHLELGRLLTHPQPTARLQVLDRIRTMLDNTQNESDLDPGVWLRKLSHDHSPAVRAAALRLMSQQKLIDLNDRIDQMARNDPSETVCQLAKYYLQAR